VNCGNESKWLVVQFLLEPLSHTHTHTHTFLHDYYDLKTDTSIVFNDEDSVFTTHQVKRNNF